MCKHIAVKSRIIYEL